jgi:hypothetical protein
MTRTSLIVLLVSLLFTAGLSCGGTSPGVNDRVNSYAYANAPGSQIFAVPRGGGTPVLLVGTDLPSEDIGRGFAFDGATAYFSDATPSASSLRSIPVAGGTPSTLVTGLGTVFDLVVDAQSMYFINMSTDVASGSVTEFIGKAPLEGGPFEMLVPSPSAPPLALAVSAGYLYWSDGGGAVNRVATAGGDVETLASNQGAIYDIAVDQSGVYWTNQGQGSVDCGSSGGSIVALMFGSSHPITLVGGLDNVGSILVSGGALYFSFDGQIGCNGIGGAGAGAVARIVPATAPPPSTPLATGLQFPSNLFVDGATFYYTTVTDTFHYVLAPHAVTLAN